MPTPRRYPFALPELFQGGAANDARQILVVDDGDGFYTLWNAI